MYNKKDAIEILNNIKRYCENISEIFCLDMAISSLERNDIKQSNVLDHINNLANDYKCYDNRLTHEEVIELYYILEIRKNKVLKVLTELRDEVSRVFDDSCYTKEQLGADKCKEVIDAFIEREEAERRTNDKA